MAGDKPESTSFDWKCVTLSTLGGLAVLGGGIAIVVVLVNNANSGDDPSTESSDSSGGGSSSSSPVIGPPAVLDNAVILYGHTCNYWIAIAQRYDNTLPVAQSLFYQNVAFPLSTLVVPSKVYTWDEFSALGTAQIMNLLWKIKKENPTTCQILGAYFDTGFVAGHPSLPLTLHPFGQPSVVQAGVSWPLADGYPDAPLCAIYYTNNWDAAGGQCSVTGSCVTKPICRPAYYCGRWGLMSTTTNYSSFLAFPSTPKLVMQQVPTAEGGQAYTYPINPQTAPTNEDLV